MKAQEIVSWLNRHVSRGAHLCLDTRQLQAGDVFFACPGQTSDGRLYIQQAAERGAAAIVMHADGVADAAPDMAVPILLVPGLVEQRGEVAHLWYGEPSTALSIVAVTGTNGKTSCVQRSEEHTSELQSLMRISYAVFCLKKKKKKQ